MLLLKKRWQIRFERILGTRRYNVLREAVQVSYSSWEMRIFRNILSSLRGIELSFFHMSMSTKNTVELRWKLQEKSRTLKFKPQLTVTFIPLLSIIYADLTGNTRTSLLGASFEMRVKRIKRIYLKSWHWLKYCVGRFGNCCCLLQQKIKKCTCLTASWWHTMYVRLLNRTSEVYFKG